MEEILLKKHDYLVIFHKYLLDSWKDTILNSNQQISIYIIEAKLLIYKGLYNKNKEQYDLGLKHFIKYSTESIELSNDIGVKIINLDFISNIYENSEGKRQLALKLKQHYDKYILLGNKIFGI
jgi:hypothetical protein